jgi:hypothetical protein
MIELVKLNNPNEVKTCLERDELYKNTLGITDLEEWDIDLLSTYYFLVKDNGVDVGVLVLREFSSNCLCFHGGAYKEHRGKETPRRLKESLQLIKDLLNCKFITTVSAYNKAALRVDKAIGFEIKTIIKDGCKSGDLYILGEK